MRLNLWAEEAAPGVMLALFSDRAAHAFYLQLLFYWNLF